MNCRDCAEESERCTVAVRANLAQLSVSALRFQGSAHEAAVRRLVDKAVAIDRELQGWSANIEALRGRIREARLFVVVGCHGCPGPARHFTVCVRHFMQYLAAARTRRQRSEAERTVKLALRNKLVARPAASGSLLDTRIRETPDGCSVCPLRLHLGPTVRELVFDHLFTSRGSPVADHIRKDALARNIELLLVRCSRFACPLCGSRMSTDPVSVQLHVRRECPAATLPP